MHAPAESDQPLHTWSVRKLADGLAARRFTAVDVVEACLRRIAERESDLKAWAFIDPDHARAQAKAAAQGALHGIPFGVKDVLDTAGLPTQMGSSLYAGHRPPFDAGIVGQLRAAGGIVLGKTVTAEFAGTQPAVTSNPHRLDHTPGGSSSGSAAAVADGMAPFALGTQTGGSVLRPAAFCGVVGFKPTFGFYTPAGMKIAAHSFDTLGLIARTSEDVSLLHDVLMNDRTAPPAVEAPRIGVLKTHLWETVDADSRSALDRAVALARADGLTVRELAAPQGFETITERRAVINAFERARGLASEFERDRAGMSAQSVDVCERGNAISGGDYVAARRDVEAFRRSVDELFDGVDAILTPVTPGEAPAGKGYAGDPRLQELWTMLHLPSLTIPVLRGRSGLPVGVQFVGARFSDRLLLQIAGWFERRLAFQLFQ